MKISIAITTHNRHEVFQETYKNIKKFLPEGAKLIVVDDGSDVPVKEADFRFKTTQGIAVAKNKCLELMGEADYYFLFDDDCYPKVKDWHLHYINTGLNHLCFSFDTFSNGKTNGRRKVGEHGNVVYWHEPCGLMLFLTRKCLDVVGGFDPAYGRWGYEHVGYSMRIQNAGLTPKPFMDVKNSLDLFHSFDWDQTVKRSVDSKDRARCIIPNHKKYVLEKKSSHYIPYKPLKSVVITCYFTQVIDPQRGTHFESDIIKLIQISDSIKNNGCDLVVINDCFNSSELKEKLGDHAKCWYYSTNHGNPYFNRWVAISKYLFDHPEIDQVFCVDATDVEMQVNPFMEIQKGYLYVGDEAGNTVNNVWLKKHHWHSKYMDVYNHYGNKPLLNAGIVGGFRNDVLKFCALMMGCYENTREGQNQLTDMAALQYVCYIALGYDKIKHGSRINTRFKANERNTTSYFKHK